MSKTWAVKLCLQITLISKIVCHRNVKSPVTGNRSQTTILGAECATGSPLKAGYMIHLAQIPSPRPRIRQNPSNRKAVTGKRTVNTRLIKASRTGFFKTWFSSMPALVFVTPAICLFCVSGSGLAFCHVPGMSFNTVHISDLTATLV